MAINPSTFGSKIKDIRLQKRYSLRQVAKQSKIDDQPEISPSYWSLIERGERNIPKNDTLKRIARGLREPEEKILALSGFVPIDFKNPTEVGTDPSQPAIFHLKLPVYGEIHAGSPTYADENIIGHVSISEKFIERYGINNLFALLIKGDSMSRVVPEKFTAVFVKDEAPEDGDIVAILLDGDEATIKRYHETSMAYIFEPDSYNPAYQPITVNKEKADSGYCRILGKYLYATSEGI